MQSGTVEINIENHIGTITFGHPAQNSLPGYLLSKLADTITEAGKNPEIRVVVLKSEGDRTFCAGASFDELASIQNEEQGNRFFMGFANVINACRTCPKLIIGRIQGKAVGGGVGLASAVDYAIASQYASVKLSELAVGIGPFVVGPAVERKMGTAAFTKLAINATEWQTARWAGEKGLFDEVFETMEQVDAYINHLSTRLANSSPDAMENLKRIFWEDYSHWDTLLKERAAISGKLVLSDFTKEAISQFKTGR